MEQIKNLLHVIFIERKEDFEENALLPPAFAPRRGSAIDDEDEEDSMMNLSILEPAKLEKRKRNKISGSAKIDEKRREMQA